MTQGNVEAKQSRSSLYIKSGKHSTSNPAHENVSHLLFQGLLLPITVYGYSCQKFLYSWHGFWVSTFPQDISCSMSLCKSGTAYFPKVYEFFIFVWTTSVLLKTNFWSMKYSIKMLIFQSIIFTIAEPFQMNVASPLGPHFRKKNSFKNQIR